MRKKRAIDALFASTRRDILSAMLLQPEKAWYVSELARHMHTGASSLQRELADLHAADIIKARRSGRMVFYQANVHHPIFSDLQSLFVKTTGFVDVLAAALESAASRIHVAFVYGSIASGVETSTSDVDLLIVGTVKPIEVALALQHASRRLSREVNPVFYKLTEFAKKRANNDHFITRVMAGSKIFILGKHDDLE